MMSLEHDSTSIAATPPEGLEEAAQITFEGIAAAVGGYHDFSEEKLVGEEREDFELDDARAVLYMIAADYADLSIEGIAAKVNRRPKDVNVAIERIRQRVDEDEKFHEHVETLKRVAAGEPLQITPAIWQELAIQHSGLPREEVMTGRGRRAVETRQLIAHLMVEKTVLPKNGYCSPHWLCGRNRCR